MQGHLLRQALQAKNLGSPFIVSIIKEQWPVELGLELYVFVCHY